MSLLPKVGKEAPLAMRLLQPAARVGYQGLTSGLVNKAQGGEFGTGAGVGLLGGVGGEAMKAAAPYLAESALGTRWLERGGGRGGGAEFEFDGTGFSDFFEQMFGSRMRGGGFGGQPGFAGEPVEEPGRDIEGDIMVTLEEAKRGSVRTVTVRRENRTDSHQVKIPAGITEGQKLRIAGRGEHGGDLYLRIRLARHPDFEVDGHNLIYELELAPWEAALGAEIAVPTLDGKVNIKFPAGSASGQKLRVRGRGLGKAGDLLVVTKIVVPDKISAEAKKLWAQLAYESKFNPRD